ncbi:MAG: hypothetical protein NVSMB62_01440 [Acidobacteriaceae bacterium]
MAFRPAPLILLAFAALSCVCKAPTLHAQVFVVGEKTATADVDADFRPTRVELPSKPMDELSRRELLRDLQAEQGFAHRALPLGNTVTLMANGRMTPAGEQYKQILYKKGQCAAPGDRVAITAISFAKDRILLDIDGGPYLKHRFLRHLELNDMPVVANNGEQVSGFRVALVFEGGVPAVSAPEVKALLDPIIDFGVKSSNEAYATTLPPFLKEAISHHDVLVGMNRRMVLASAGAPETKVRELVEGSDNRHYEEWIYGKVPQTVRFIRIENDRVTEVRTAALGQPIAVKTENELEGYLDPLDEHEIAMGDSASGHDEEARPAGEPPTLRKPGDPPLTAGSQKVQYPVAHKEQPLPAAPGSPADTSRGRDLPAVGQQPLDHRAPGINSTPEPIGTPVGRGNVPPAGRVR